MKEAGDVYNVEKVIIHPNFNILLIHNDIGLLHLKTDIVFNNVVQPIPVAITNSVLVGDPCFLTGWGTLKVRSNELNISMKGNQSFRFSFILSSIKLYLYLSLFR